MLKGETLTLADGKEYTLAPLTLGALEDYADRIEQLAFGGVDKESVQTVIEVAHASLKRNYPDMTRDQVRDLIDLSMMGEVLGAAMSASGINPKVPGAGEAQGARSKARRR